MLDLKSYNTQNDNIQISEYGRIIQEYVKHIINIPEKDKRTKMAEVLVGVMEVLNPTSKEQADYKQKFWDHLHIISDFKLDVDSPYKIPEREMLNQKPEKVNYPSQPIKFRFYGRNLQYMIKKASDIENDELKKDFVNILATFMANSAKNWNNENLNNEQISKHISNLSSNKISINSEDLEIVIDNKNNHNQNQNIRPNGFKKKKKKKKKNNVNF